MFTKLYLEKYCIDVHEALPGEVDVHEAQESHPGEDVAAEDPHPCRGAAAAGHPTPLCKKKHSKMISKY